METNTLNKTLEELGFDTQAQAQIYPDIVFTAGTYSNLHPKHYIALEFAELYTADAVFFRYYDDNRFCAPQIYFYDNTLRHRTKQQIAIIHRMVYSSCQVPMICIVDKTSIKLFDCRQPIKIKNKVESNDHCLFKESDLDKLADISHYFSAKQLQYGFFWETDEASEHFTNNQSAYQLLVKVLTDIRKAFIARFVQDDAIKNLENDKQARALADDILFKCILIKYLEENGKDTAKDLDYARDFYRRKGLGCDSLNGILKAGKLIDLLTSLDSHFNGDVFKFEEFKDEGGRVVLPVSKVKELVQQYNLSALAECLDGQLDKNKQLALWSLYSFKDIPIELISNFYEEFIPKTVENKGTVYTPSFLVNLLIDECLPLSNKTDDKSFNVKLIDVSCGSGIFITSAYKRLVQRWRIAKGTGGKPLAKDSIRLREVKDILSKNIFGVDLHPTAVKLTKFSLQLALCQLLPNNELWHWGEEKVFDNLANNVSEADFFDFLVERTDLHNQFDLVLGNPPFEAITTDLYSAYVSKLQSIGFELQCAIPRNELALLFLECSSLLLHDSGDLCLIQKSTSLLYNTGAQAFRTHLFNQFHIHQIIDFTLLKNDLFKSSKVKKDGQTTNPPKVSVEAVAVFYRKEIKDDYVCNHIISRLLKNTKDGVQFEFDYYDFHDVTKAKAITDSNVWRCNLLGGNRLNHLVNRLTQDTNTQVGLKIYLKDCLGLEDERYGVGFKNETTDPHSAPYIINKRILLGKNWGLDKIAYTKYDESKRFNRTREALLYEAPLINIKTTIVKNSTLLIFHDEDTAFNETIVGISAPQAKEAELKILYSILQKNKKVHCLQTLATCAQFFMGSTTPIQKKDIDKWVIPLKEDEINLSFGERIVLDDTLDYLYPSWYEGEKATINQTITDDSLLRDFADIFNQSFNSIYQTGDKAQRLRRIIEGSAFFALEFYYSDQDTETETICDGDLQIDALLQHNISSNALINRVLRIYSKNTITLVKPKSLRYWLKSVALRDADDVFDDIIENGLK